MSIKQRIQDWLRDDEAARELDERERRTDEVAQALREQRERNNFGEMFQVAFSPPRRPHHKKKGHIA